MVPNKKSEKGSKQNALGQQRALPHLAPKKNMPEDALVDPYNN